MRTKSKACPNNNCVGLSDVLDDLYLDSSDDHMLVVNSSPLGCNISRLQSDSAHSVWDANIATAPPFCQINDCIQGLENQKSDTTIAASHGMSSAMLASTLSPTDSRSHDLPTISSTAADCMTWMGASHFKLPVTEYSVLSPSSPAIASVSHPPLFQ